MKKVTIILAALVASVSTFGQNVINFSDYAASMGGEKNARIVLKKILDDNKGKQDITVNFAKGRYDFYPEKYVQDGPYEAGILLEGVNGLTIDGNGSEFVYHGMMKIAVIQECAGVTLKDFSIDWDRPLISQCQVVGTADDYIDVTIDKEKYPYNLDKGHIMFTGEGWEYPITGYFNVYTPEGEIAYNTWDGTVSTEMATAKVEVLDSGVLRFHCRQTYRPAPGYYIELYHKRYAVNGFEVNRSKDTVFEDITIYHSLSHGIVCSMCENVSELGVKMIPNKAKGRIFSTVADASHFVNCKGDVIFRGCECAGQGDDFLNVHGRNVKIISVCGKNTVEVKAPQWFLPGDSVALVGQVSGQREFILTVKESGDGKVTFNEPIPDCVNDRYFLESMTWTASLTFENNTVTKCNRARGILVTTPKPVMIRNNVFRSAGTAILIEGDTDFWFESGACADVTITGNLFDNCLTSGNKVGDRWQWGDGIITITPSHRPANSDSPAYHKNIKIIGNEFRMFDTSIMRACSVDGLTFKGNKIIRTYDYKPYTWYKDSFTLEGCRNVKISGNKFDKDYKTRTVRGYIMKDSDVKAKGLSVTTSEGPAPTKK